MQKMIIERLSVLEKDVLNSIKNDVQDEDKDMTINAVARRNFVSQALLVKLSKKLGFSGYRDLLFHLRQSQAEEMSQESPLLKGSYRSVIRNYSESMRLAFAEYFKASEGTVISVFGIEESAPVADFIARHIVVNGPHYTAYCGRPLEPAVGEASGLALVVSAAGDSDIVLDMIERARKLGCRSIALTGNDRSRAAAAADLSVIAVERNPEFPDINLFVPMAITAFLLLYENM